MKIEILFKDAAGPKKIRHVAGFYTKAEFFCVRVGDLIIRYPLCSIFSVCSKHGDHLGSRKSIEKAHKKSKRKKS